MSIFAMAHHWYLCKEWSKTPSRTGRIPFSSTWSLAALVTNSFVSVCFLLQLWIGLTKCFLQTVGPFELRVQHLTSLYLWSSGNNAWGKVEGPCGVPSHFNLFYKKQTDWNWFSGQTCLVSVRLPPSMGEYALFFKMTTLLLTMIFVEMPEKMDNAMYRLWMK